MLTSALIVSLGLAATTYTNCYTGNTWNTSICTSGGQCASNCALEGANWTCLSSINCLFYHDSRRFSSILFYAFELAVPKRCAAYQIRLLGVV